MFDTVEKSLTCGGILVAVGFGKVFSFWHGVLIGGALLFLVAFLFLWVELFLPSVGMVNSELGMENGDGGLSGGIENGELGRVNGGRG